MINRSFYHEVAPPTKPRAALKRHRNKFKLFLVLVAPPTKPRAALKLPILAFFIVSGEGCTTHKAACGIETK